MWNRLHFAPTSVFELQFLNQYCIAKKMKGNTICSSLKRVLLSLWLSINNGECRACTNDKTVLTTVATLHENNCMGHIKICINLLQWQCYELIPWFVLLFGRSTVTRILFYFSQHRSDSGKLCISRWFNFPHTSRLCQSTMQQIKKFAFVSVTHSWQI